VGAKHIWAEQFDRQIGLHYDYGKDILLCVLVKSVVNVGFVCVVIFFWSSEIMYCIWLYLKKELHSYARGVSCVAYFITIDKQLQ